MKNTNCKIISSMLVFVMLACLMSYTAFAAGIRIESTEDATQTAELPKGIALAYQVASSISPDAFGGFYRNSKGEIVMNICEDYKEQIMHYSSILAMEDIKIGIVKFSLKFLTSVKDALSPHMLKYNIAMIDANDETNKVDIVLYRTNDQLLDFVAQFIDLEYVNISVLEEGAEIRLTVGDINNIDMP